MSDILEKFNIFSKISEQFKQNIKLFHVFDASTEKSALLVTNEDKLFAFGSNICGKCGFGHSKRVDTPIEIPELNGKQIKQFFIGEDFVLALNENNKVFGWGRNQDGQLARKYRSGYDEYLKPEPISDLENIIGISCGDNHSLALDREGNIFSWGNNYSGQVGSGKESGYIITGPVKMKGLPKIQSIHCYNYRSFAVTIAGFVYSWGNFFSGHEPQRIKTFKPKLINELNNIISVGCFKDNTYFLTNEGNIYFCGKIDSQEQQKRPKLLKTDLKFQSLQTIYSNVLALSEEIVYCLKENTIKETKYKTVFDYCLNEKQITSETMSKPIEIEYLLLGSGKFGTVYKWMKKGIEGNYALKIISYQGEKISEYQREVETLSKCKEKYVVKYFRSWIDKNKFYIQMEFCDNNLKNIIQRKRKCFERQTNSEISLTEYFISSEIMKEILECVQYLHQMNPPIIHRDLKPQNILVNYQPKNGRFIKLCDFGLVAFESDQTLSHTRGVGTTIYMAPEVIGFEEKNKLRVKYNTKADIYSLGQIFTDLIDFDINSSEQENKLGNLIEQMLFLEYNRRPDCNYLLNELINMNVSIYLEIKKQNDPVFQLSESKYQFFSNYLNQKLIEYNKLEDKHGQIEVISKIFINELAIEEYSSHHKELTFDLSLNDSNINSFKNIEKSEDHKSNSSQNTDKTLESKEQSFAEIFEKIFSDFFSDNCICFDENVLFVTKDDKIFAFGSNSYGRCGFGHNNRVALPQEIPELNGKQIKQFFIGDTFVLALNEKNQVFGWGQNNYGQLGRGYTSGEKEYNKPDIIPDFENIIEISCGLNHSLALDRDGNIFLCGWNLIEQSGITGGFNSSRPVQLKELPKIKSIHCYNYRSFAVTFDGLVFSWGYNYEWDFNYCLGHESKENNTFKPKLINGLNNVIFVGCSINNTYFLTKEGNIYFCGKIDLREYQETPKILETDMKFQFLNSIYYYSNENSNVLVSNEENAYHLIRNSIKNTKYKTVSDYSLKEKQKILENLKLKLSKSFESYEKLCDLGFGGFATVIKVKDKLSDNIYALKITNEYNKEIKKEAKQLSKCNTKFVVKLYDYWIEENKLFLKMELCSDNLDNIIEKKKECFERQSTDVMTKIEFFISTHLMKEIVECVQSLHQMKPPIIHRDLKPANILVNYQPKKGRFIKLTDFGLSTLGSEITISRTRCKGTAKYMAPEVINGEKGTSSMRVKYSIKADIYSLGKIICDLFDLDINSLDMKNNEFTQNWIELVHLTKNMLENKYQNRPSCSDILSSHNLCSIEKMTEIDNNSEENQKNIKQMEEFDNKFFIDYFNEKQKL